MRSLPRFIALIIACLVLGFAVQAQIPLIDGEPDFTSLDNTLSFDLPAGWTATEYGSLIHLTNEDESIVVNLTTLGTNQMEVLADAYLEMTGEPITPVALMQIFTEELPETMSNIEDEIGFPLSIPDAVYGGEITVADVSGAYVTLGERPLYVFDVSQDDGIFYVLAAVLYGGESALDGLETILGSMSYTPFSFDLKVFTPIRVETVVQLTPVTKYPFTGTVRSVEVFPDSERFAVATGGQVLIVDIASGEWLHVLTDPDVFVLLMALSHDGTRLATVGENVDRDNVYTIWDTSTGEQLLQITDDESLSPDDIAFSPDDSLLAVSPGEVFLYDTATGELVSHLEQRREYTAFSPDGTLIATNCVQLYTFCINDLATGEILQSITDVDERFPQLINDLAYTPDGTGVIVGYADMNDTPEMVVRWDLASGEAQVVYNEEAGIGGHHDSIMVMRINADGTLLATADNSETLGLWNAVTGEGIFLIEDPLGEESYADVTSIAFTPDGRAMLTGGSDGALLLWAIPSE